MSPGVVFVALAIGGSAAGDCQVRVSAEEFRTEIDEAVAELVAGDPSAALALRGLVSRLACVDGPLFGEDLGRLYLTWGLSLYGSDRGGALDRMRWASNLGADWIDDFGQDNRQRAYAAIRDAAGAPATLRVRSTDGADVLLVDGWVVGAGEVSVLDGAHLVQWRTPEGWRADWVIVASGQTVWVGPEPIAVQDHGASTPTWGEVSTALRAYRGDIYDGYRRWDGVGLSPSLRADGRLGLRGPWFLDAGLSLGSAAREERPPMASGTQAAIGYRRGDAAWVALSLGARGTALAAVEPGVDADLAPRFRESWRLGGAGALAAGAAVGPVALDLAMAGALYGVGWEAWGALTGGLGAAAMEPIARLSAGLIGVEAAWGRESRYDWYSAEVGIRWRLQ